jgi:hypothetical protein
MFPRNEGCLFSSSIFAHRYAGVLSSNAHAGIVQRLFAIVVLSALSLFSVRISAAEPSGGKHTVAFDWPKAIRLG